MVHALVPWTEKCPTLPCSSAPHKPNFVSSPVLVALRLLSGSKHTWGESGLLWSKSLCAVVVIVVVMICRNLCRNALGKHCLGLWGPKSYKESKIKGTEE